jgi:hypothetical protein
LSFPKLIWILPLASETKFILASFGDRFP